jgi:A/G-specific adenine glycosylase
MSKFAAALIAWHPLHGRRALPWQGTTDPYRIWLSEIMLQQTQVAAVIPYYERFLKRFPTVAALAGASEEEVLELWSGLGYYARGRNLHAAAQKIAVELKGKFPDTAEKIEQLPGIGRSTAAAIAAFAFGERSAILDGNVKRVLARSFGIEGWPGEPAVEARLWEIAEKLLPEKGIEIYTQAMMDLGATVCTKANPDCSACPVRKDCVARKKSRVADIPAARPKKALPTKRATWLLLLHKGSILMERRPSSGLWGGLWTFPEVISKNVEAHCRTAFGCEVADIKKLKPLEHGFSHFNLQIQPLACNVRRVTRGAEESGRMWIDVEDAKGAAVPTPVRKLLLGLKIAVLQV